MSRWNWAEPYLHAQDGHPSLFASRQEQRTRTFDYVSWARLTNLKEYGALQCAVCSENLAQIDDSREICQIVLPCIAKWSAPKSKFDAGHSKDPRPAYMLCSCGCETFPAPEGQLVVAYLCGLHSHMHFMDVWKATRYVVHFQFSRNRFSVHHDFPAVIYERLDRLVSVLPDGNRV